MKKNVIRVISVLTFLVILGHLVGSSNRVLTEKHQNSYYILEKELEARNETYDVQIYGSCHAYTSFKSLYVTENYGLSAYNMSNPGEIIPVTYLRMLEWFEKDTPQVAFVEVWGLNAYETYMKTEAILGNYLSANIERLPASLEKMQVIRDFPELDALDVNVATVKYKSRLSNLLLTEADLDYSYERLCQAYGMDYDEMSNRFTHNGYKQNEPVSVAQQLPSQQPVVAEDDVLAVEEVLVKYLDKIIRLCEDKGVTLVFYRSPYLSTANELRKANWLEQYLAQKGVPYYDLEKYLELDYETDFADTVHLSKYGAQKATEYLCSQVLG